MNIKETMKRGEEEFVEKTLSHIEKDSVALCCGDCLGGGWDYEGSVDCKSCNGTGLTDWRNDYLSEQLHKIIKQHQKDLLRAVVEEIEERKINVEAQELDGWAKGNVVGNNNALTDLADHLNEKVTIQTD